MRVAIPDHFGGAVLRVWTALAGLVLIVTWLLAPLPGRVVALIGPHNAPWLRGIAILVVLLLVQIVRRLVSTALVGAPVIALGRLRLWVRGRPELIGLAQVVGVAVERRPLPEGEVLLVELADGRTLDVCPLRYKGAGSVYQGLAKALARNRRRARERQRSAAARQRAGSLPR